jgi:hypothetical protein
LITDFMWVTPIASSHGPQRYKSVVEVATSVSWMGPTDEVQDMSFPGGIENVPPPPHHKSQALLSAFHADIALYPSFARHGLKLRNRIIWHFEHGLHCAYRLSGRHETLLWFTKGDDYHFDLDPIRVPQKYPGKRHFKGPRLGELSGNPLGKNPGDVWVIPNVKHNHVEKTVHPCQYPVELVERLVLPMTLPGQLVLDPYASVGTTVAAAVRHGRLGLGFELSAEYVAIGEARVRAAQEGTLAARPMDRAVYTPPGAAKRPAAGRKATRS